MRRGWYKESYRHSLAARGISTNRYYARPRPVGSRAMRGRGGPAQFEKKLRVVPIPPTEELLTQFFIRDLPERDRTRARQLKSELDMLRQQRDMMQSDVGLARVKDPLRGTTMESDLRAVRAQRRELTRRLSSLRSDLAEREDLLMSGVDPATLSIRQRNLLENQNLEQEIASARELLDVHQDLGPTTLSVSAEQQEAAERIKQVRDQIKEKQDELDLLTGRGERRTSFRDELLPRERILKERRSELLGDVELLQSQQARIVGVVRDKAAMRQISEFKAGAKARLDEGAITQSQYNQLIKDADSRIGMETFTTFDDPKELPITAFAGTPRRVTKLTPEFVPLPKKVDVQVRATQKQQEARARSLKSQAVAKEAESARQDLQSEGVIPPDEE